MLLFICSNKIIKKIMKLKDIASIITGFTYSRNRLESNSPFSYKLLTLKSICDNSIINEKYTEDFKSNKKIDEKFLTKENDLVIKLNYPINIIYIRKEYENLLIPLHFAIIRCNYKEIDTKFLYIFLKNYNYSSLLLTGTIPFLKLSNLNEIEIPEFLINKQRKIVDIYTLMEKEDSILKNLIEKKKLRNKIIINKLLKEKNDY